MANFNNWANGGQIGNYFAGSSGYGSTETEEQRRRREYEEAYGVVPAGGGGAGTSVTPAANAMTPSVPQIPQVAPQQQPQQSQGIQPVPPQNYNQGIAARESGGNPNIGFHDPSKSSAYGTYGLTKPAYQDVQRADPRFIGRDITALNPQEQTDAMNVYTGLNKQRLQGQGVDPTQQNLDLAHFLGPTGAKNYLSGGQVSPAAAAANGGDAAVRAEAQRRLSGQTPGAANPPAAPSTATTNMPSTVTTQQPTGTEEGGNNGYYDQKWYDTFQAAQDPKNPVGIIAMQSLMNNPTAPPGIRQAAAAQQYSVMDFDRKQQQTQQQMQKDIQDPNAITRILKEKNEEGSWAKAVLFSILGSKSLAENEYTKLGKGATWQTTYDNDGNAVLAQIRADGLPMRGYDVNTGTELSANQLASVAGGIGNSRVKPEISTQDVEKGGKAGRVVTEVRNGRTMTYVESNGKRYEYDSSWKPRSISTSAAKEENKKAIDLKYTGPIAYTAASAKFAGNFNAENGTNIGYETITPGTNPVLVDRNNGNQPVKFDSDGNIQVIKNTGGAAPAAAPAATPAKPSGPSFREPGHEQESPGQFKNRQEIAQATSKEIAGEGAKQVAASSETQADLGKIRKAIVLLGDDKKHNVGSIVAGTLEGRGPIAQTLGSLGETEASQNTEDINEAVNKVVLMRQSLGKMTDADLKFYVQGKPSMTTAPARVKRWLEQADRDLSAKLKQAGMQVEKGGEAGIAPASDSGAVKSKKEEDGSITLY